METARRQWIYAWLMLSPAMVLLITFTHYPAVQTIVNSFYSTPRGRRKAVWIGLDNYQTLLLDDVFWKVLANNFWYAVWTIPLSIILSLAMALWVNDKLRGRGFLRMAYFTPTVLPLIAVANIWLFFYTPGFGLIDQIRGLFGLPEQNWMGSPDTALYSMIAVAVWKEAGFFMIFYLAALQTIPPSLREAADIEGASRWYYFRRVLFPLLMPTTLFVSINAVINSFRLVDHIFVMTEGGPNNASSLLLFYIYEVAFDYWDTAYAATLTVVMIAVLILLAIGQFFLFDRRVHYK
ncbi:ABC transporter permease [Actibacterium mucosum KCTC 23349]|uniref:ABC transporter permease n=1 Tax=Actibacterium mucosum KCTC 23349 TaxID=1454373 RepID=A0A037ZN80_9RHOB|nr:sugar ABC transporter permease [Actibacterium mucosum]KAJ57105.1 ABC transporter permease [Actibacterium mucosum KCTC 23349]